MHFAAIVGDGGVIDAAELGKRSAGAYRFDTLKAGALVRPVSTQQVSEVLRWCHANQVGVVTHGGLTGLVHGADAAPSEVILSLERMRAIEDIDPRQRTATVQAGVPLQALQEAVDKHDLAFPLDLGARGSATLGGNAATNAGGNRVIRYGMTRDMMLGLEVVLADGTVLSSMNKLIKNNAGYDLKQLFIGSEGTLGVITRLVLRLREKPLATNMAFAGLDSFDAVGGLPQALRPRARRHAVGVRGDVAVVLSAGHQPAGEGPAADRAGLCVLRAGREPGLRPGARRSAVRRRRWRRRWSPG